MRFRLLILLLLSGSLLLTACASQRPAGDLRRGKINFEAGYYREALRQLLPLAAEGNREAEYAVGYMYYYGYGVSQDSEAGLFWISKAAEQDYRPAIKALQALDKAS